jgi:hypothetical protein
MIQEICSANDESVLRTLQRSQNKISTIWELNILVQYFREGDS